MSAYIDANDPTYVAMPVDAREQLHGWVANQGVQLDTVFRVDVEDDQATFHVLAFDQHGTPIVCGGDFVSNQITKRPVDPIPAPVLEHLESLSH